ncbi:hypothetical protein HZC00_05165 [Candidatus Kaiserbacteria bacterium]|nr:hypothetical protein [Candidatus Kaiserbacteria bacterium]
MQDSHILLPLLELAAALAAGILVISFVLTYLYGQETARTRRIFRATYSGFDECQYQDAYDRHRFYRWMYLGSFTVAILVIESMVRIAGVSFEFTPLKVAHYTLDGIYCILLGLTLWYNGFRSEFHGKFAYWLAVSGIGVLTTGLYLYVDFILKH